MHIDSPSFTAVIIAPHCLQEHVPGKDFPLVLHQEQQEIKFFRCEGQRLTIEGNLMAVNINPQALQGDHMLAGRCCLGRPAQSARTLAISSLGLKGFVT